MTDPALASVVVQLAETAERLAGLERLVSQLGAGVGQQAFVEHVYRPGFGHLAARLRPCWEHHDLCLYCLDIAAELHAVLYLQSRRTPSVLSGQAEYATRVLPALADLMSAETRTGCQHHAAAANGQPVISDQARRLP